MSVTDSLLPVAGSHPAAPAPTTPPVTAVLVTRGTTRYLSTTLRALAGQTRRPSRLVVVDAGRQADPDVERLARGVIAGLPSEVRVVHAPGARTFGHAVRQGLGSTAAPAGPEGWLWLLHDDSAPAPTALAELVRAVEHAPSVGVAGVKQRTWTDPERLLEVGLRTSRSGRRMTGVEVGEMDQGQHDARDDVLGVGLAGALVRRDVWDDLGGTDPALGPFGDGLDLSRRARLAGHRVVVVPSAVVRHAQASYHGLRGDGGAEEDVDRDGDGQPDAGDHRRSFGARRRASVHQLLVGAPLVLMPVVGLLAILGGPFRALARLVSKEPGLAVVELTAPIAAASRLVAIGRARRTATRTRRLRRGVLRPLQATSRDVWVEWRDRRLARAEGRRTVHAPSELELRELAALATRRRVGLGVLAVTLVAASLVALGPLAGQALAGARLVGGALSPAAGAFGDVWTAATSGWSGSGLGAAAPGDPLWGVLLPATLVVDAQGVVSVLLLGSVLLAGLGAWAAAGAATRSVGVRLWAALVWATAPALLLGVGDGRLGATLAHVALPWVVLGVVRAVGAQRVDTVLSGLVTARRGGDEDDDAAGVVHDELPGADRTPDAGSVTTTTRVGATAPTGSIAAAAGAALAFVVVAAGSPVLLLPGVVGLLLVAAVAPRRRGRVLLVPVPALVVLGPLLVEALARGAAGVRLLVADPGLPLASTPVTPLFHLLGVPADPGTLVPSGVPDALRTAWPLATGAVVLVLAALALLRGVPVARAVRVAWVVAALGVLVAGAAQWLVVATHGDQAVTGWAGPGVSLAGAGLLAAAVTGTDGLRERMARYVFGLRQLMSLLLTVAAVAVVVVALGSWGWQARAADGVGLRALDRPVVPAVGQQSQLPPEASRVLALAAGADGVTTWQLLEGDGPQLLDLSTAVSTSVLVGPPTDPSAAPVDDATAEVAEVVGRLAAAADGDVAPALAALGVSDVLVPVLGDAADATGAAAEDLRQQRAALVGRLDATAGLERITQTSAGVIWRVQPTAAAPGAAVPDLTSAWARLAPAADDPAPTPPVAVPSDGRTVDARVEAGAEGRLLVLAERSAPGWHATLDGRPLRAVAHGWRQAFEVGADAGRLVVTYDAPQRWPWLLVQGAVLLVTVLMAVPVRRRRGGAA